MQLRPRAQRTTETLRQLVAQTTLEPRNLMMPIFVRENLHEPKQISGMPGIYQQSLASLPEHLDQIMSAGILSVMLFGIPEEKDPLGSQATKPSGILHAAVKLAKSHAGSRLVVVADVCLDEFTSHGHCGLLDEHGAVLNDATLEVYQRMALQLAIAGADVLGLSGMMDNQVAAVRAVLEANQKTDTLILAYSAKFASGFYAPFRNAVESSLQGDRKSYQQDYRNPREARLEIQLDLNQGADFVMVKPALSYLDVISKAAEISHVPVMAYMVSGEYAMLNAAFETGALERERLILETHYSVRRAGADVICTYFALELAQLLGNQ